MAIEGSVADTGGVAKPAADAGSQGATGAKPDVTQQKPDDASSTQKPGTGSNTGVDDKKYQGLTADLQKERKARQDAIIANERTQAELAQVRKQMQALAGITPKDDAEQEFDAIRAQFAKVFPGLAKLTDAQIEKLMGVADKADSLSEATTHHWQRHGSTMLDALEKAVVDEIGGDLTERQKKALTQAYVNEAQTNDDFLKKHEAGDLDQLTAFAKEWVGDWMTAASRKVTKNAVGQFRPVPRGGDRSTTGTGGGKKIDFKDEKAVEDAMVESFRSRGGQFAS